MRLAIVPDIPRFDTSAFEFYVTLKKLPVAITRLAMFNEQAISSNDYILASEKYEGFEAGSYLTTDLRVINEYLNRRSETFHVLESFSLPNGDVIRLYKVGNS